MSGHVLGMQGTPELFVSPRHPNYDSFRHSCHSVVAKILHVLDTKVHRVAAESSALMIGRMTHVLCHSSL